MQSRCVSLRQKLGALTQSTMSVIFVRFSSSKCIQVKVECSVRSKHWIHKLDLLCTNKTKNCSIDSLVITLHALLFQSINLESGVYI